METKQWSVRIDISESGKDTHVHAVLVTMNGTVLEGQGHARRYPRDRAVPKVGDKLAADRPLIDLGSPARATRQYRHGRIRPVVTVHADHDPPIRDHRRQ
ncbi:hypothetical protein GCM10029978_074620 [Actinoallomurus acanthiterrae]